MNVVETMLSLKGWTQSDLAELLKADPGNVNRCIRGHKDWPPGHLEIMAEEWGLKEGNLVRTILTEQLEAQRAIAEFLDQIDPPDTPKPRKRGKKRA